VGAAVVHRRVAAKAEAEPAEAAKRSNSFNRGGSLGCRRSLRALQMNSIGTGDQNRSL
jgi:hypothetical protein